MSSSESASRPVIRAEHVTRTLAGEVPVTLVEEVNLEIERGEFVCVMGPSGSGKSSLLYLLGLLDMPTRGRIWIDGEDTTAFDDDQLTDFRLTKLGYVATDLTRATLVAGLDTVSRTNDGLMVKSAKKAGKTMIFTMTPRAARQVRKVLE